MKTFEQAIEEFISQATHELSITFAPHHNEIINELNSMDIIWAFAHDHKNCTVKIDIRQILSFKNFKLWDFVSGLKYESYIYGDDEAFASIMYNLYFPPLTPEHAIYNSKYFIDVDYMEMFFCSSLSVEQILNDSKLFVSFIENAPDHIIDQLNGNKNQNLEQVIKSLEKFNPDIKTIFPNDTRKSFKTYLNRIKELSLFL